MSSGSTDATKGCTAAKPASTARARAGSTSAPNPQSAPSASRPSAACTARNVAVWKDETITRAVQPGLLDRRRRQRRHGLPGVPPRVLGRVLDLDVDHHAFADGQDVGQQGHVGGQVGHPELVDRADTGDLRVVVDGQGPVRREAHIELDAVGTQPPGLGEGVDGVLGEPLGTTPVCEDRGHRGPVIFPSRFHRDSGRTFIKNSLPGCRQTVTLFSVNPLFTDGHLLDPIM